MASNRPRTAHEIRLRRLRGEQRIGAIADDGPAPAPVEGSSIDLGWGTLLFGQTFPDSASLAQTMRDEDAGRRNIAFYVHEPQVVLAAAPQELFLDPSHAFRLDLATYRPSPKRPSGFFVRRLTSRSDAEEVNRLYAARGMITVPADYFWERRDSRSVAIFVAEDETDGSIIGTVMGVDHTRAFDDIERGASLWSLAVDPQARQPGIGEELVRHVAGHARARGANYLDLSVLHDNTEAIGLYEKIGFKRLYTYAIKRRNPINEDLFTGSDERIEKLNTYARIIVDEARRRGIHADITDPEGGIFRLTWGGRSIRCRESLSELTSGVAVAICDDKAVTRRIVAAAGLRVPDEIEVGGMNDAAAAFLEKHGSVVVKPARGEQGRGVAVGLETREDMEKAIENARSSSDRILIEHCAEGTDLRIIVIDYEVVAAALRRPAHVVGDGRSTVGKLIERFNRRRLAATSGESSIPLDSETERNLKMSGYGYDDVPPEGEEIRLRRTANLHTGGTIHDVTDRLHPELAAAAVDAAVAIDIPVVGLDFMVPDVEKPDYVFIEANERPGLAFHEPQPTVARFVDLLYPSTVNPRGDRSLPRP